MHNIIGIHAWQNDINATHRIMGRGLVDLHCSANLCATHSFIINLGLFKANV